MEIIISGNSSKPIYAQITEQLKAQIMDGTLHAGESLPSMRSLAKSLHVSVITVQRAYEDFWKQQSGGAALWLPRIRKSIGKNSSERRRSTCWRRRKLPVSAAFRWNRWCRH